ncbi:putative phage abortive infection protein [Sphingomonas montana]|uniref:putative phage abortive infection protein n=1 Tax=Sphingomonas montana TaxID=1843236 RepID=UPI003B82FFC7
MTKKDLARLYRVRVHTRFEARLGAYYRVIYTILRRVSEDSVLSDSDKRGYGNLLRSQLQSQEVLLLALNGLTGMSNNFSDYLIEFRIMKYLPSITMRRILLAGYPKEAFEARD